MVCLCCTIFGSRPACFSIYYNGAFTYGPLNFGLYTNVSLSSSTKMSIQNSYVLLIFDSTWARGHIGSITCSVVQRYNSWWHQQCPIDYPITNYSHAFTWEQSNSECHPSWSEICRSANSIWEEVLIWPGQIHEWFFNYLQKKKKKRFMNGLLTAYISLLDTWKKKERKKKTGLRCVCGSCNSPSMEGFWSTLAEWSPPGSAVIRRFVD